MAQSESGNALLRDLLSTLPAEIRELIYEELLDDEDNDHSLFDEDFGLHVRAYCHSPRPRWSINFTDDIFGVDEELSAPEREWSSRLLRSLAALQLARTSRLFRDELLHLVYEHYFSELRIWVYQCTCNDGNHTSHPAPLNEYLTIDFVRRSTVFVTPGMEWQDINQTLSILEYGMHLEQLTVVFNIEISDDELGDEDETSDLMQLAETIYDMVRKWYMVRTKSTVRFVTSGSIDDPYMEERVLVFLLRPLISIAPVQSGFVQNQLTQSHPVVERARRCEHGMDTTDGIDEAVDCSGKGGRIERRTRLEWEDAIDIARDSWYVMERLHWRTLPMTP